MIFIFVKNFAYCTVVVAFSQMFGELDTFCVLKGYRYARVGTGTGVILIRFMNGTSAYPGKFFAHEILIGHTRKNENGQKKISCHCPFKAANNGNAWCCVFCHFLWRGTQRAPLLQQCVDLWRDVC